MTTERYPFVKVLARVTLQTITKIHLRPGPFREGGAEGAICPGPPVKIKGAPKFAKSKKKIWTVF